MASPFDSLTLAQLAERTKAAPIDAGADANRKFYAGDHWQEGTAWQGPQPTLDDPTTAATVLGEIKRAFVSKNAIREVVGRHVAGVVGREPAWGLTPRRPLKLKQKPTQAEQKLIDEAEAALTAWWDERGGLTLLQEATATLLLTGRSSMRLFVPPGLMANGLVPPGGLAEQLGRLFLHHPAPEMACVLVDAATQQRCSVYRYREANQECAELSYVDMESGETVLRVLRGETRREIRLPLGGHLLMHEMVRPALVTEQVRSLQMQLNLAKTMEGRNAVQGGFLERIVLGGQMPGDWVDDPAAAPDSEGRRRRFKPRTLKIGAGRTNWIAGLPIRDANGNTTGYTNPSVVYRDPVSPETFQQTSKGAHLDILDEVDQLHAAIAGDATASGKSREQARAGFETSLAPTKAQIDRLGRWLLETALTLAAHFAGQSGRYAGLRATFDCRIDTGPLSSEERKALGDEVDRGLLSPETFLAIVGHDDPDAEMARIAAARAARQAQSDEDESQEQDTNGSSTERGDRSNDRGNSGSTDPADPAGVR
jgi:hypothetical protein